VIWLLRHGKAEDAAADDASRRLTAAGERQAKAAGLALAALGAQIETCLSSPKVRAAETARLAAAELGLAVELSDHLAGGDFDLAELVAGRGETLLVGHEPDFSRAIQLATGARVKLSKGGVAAIEKSTLIALLTPDALAMLGTS
jgi:phosphohistidine phosphatase